MIINFKKNPSQYVQVLARELNFNFKPMGRSIFSESIVEDLISAFHGFNSMDAFLRALNSFDGFYPYSAQSRRFLRNDLYKLGMVNVYRYLTNLNYKNRITENGREPSTFNSNFAIKGEPAYDIAEFIVDFHTKHALTFVDLIEVRTSLYCKLPTNLYRFENNFFEGLDFYSRSFIKKSSKLKRASHVVDVANQAHLVEVLPFCLKDTYGFFDISSLFTYMRIFMRVSFKDASNITGRLARHAGAYHADKRYNPCRNVPDYDWVSLCEFTNISISQGQLSFARFLYRFFHHPKRITSLTAFGPMLNHVGYVKINDCQFVMTA